MTETTETEFCSTKEAARLLDVTVDTVLVYIKRKQLPSERLADNGRRHAHGGPRHRIRRADVQALLRTRTPESPDPLAAYEATPTPKDPTP